MSLSGRSYSWPVPYIRSLDGEYQPGQCIFVKGYMLGERFNINVTAGPNVQGDPMDDIGLHVSVRVDEKAFVLNTLQGGQWGKEERHKLNIKDNEEFEIRIRAHSDEFEMFANGKEICKYKYRMPLTLLNHLYIEGAVELYRVSWEGRYYAMPFETPVPAPKPGQAIYVAGVVDAKAKRFDINLKAGEDFVLHVNPRFDEKRIVRNHCENGQWGPEEVDGDFTLKRDRTFDIIIGCTDQGYEIFVDGKPYATFAHRIPPARVDKLTIDGEVQIQGVHW